MTQHHAGRPAGPACRARRLQSLQFVAHPDQRLCLLHILRLHLRQPQHLYIRHCAWHLYFWTHSFAGKMYIELDHYHMARLAAWSPTNARQNLEYAEQSCAHQNKLLQLLTWRRGGWMSRPSRRARVLSLVIWRCASASVTACRDARSSSLIRRAPRRCTGLLRRLRYPATLSLCQEDSGPTLTLKKLSHHCHDVHFPKQMQ